ncbi:ABC transporter substrate-binding protein [Nocardioides carbamazepini]|uniref:ABC transporter substrate-binding protein n=1 Tax=Nocardioides carbamazepini TaxID=2854259 RepID=UPI00214A54F1|nr:ABC transporter substrate-binding protein [Nocardioides carbamazepini]MCR1783950.1 ABC transporter substrate-binding protein [Nocardioides carbamazepini]
MDARRLAATVETDPDGRLSARPAGALSELSGLAGHLRTAATTSGIGAIRFVWLEPESQSDPTPARSATAVSVGPRRSDGRRTVHLHRADTERLAGLNRRELQVLTLIAAGLANPGIAERLVVGRRTVATHVEHLLAKLGVSNRAAAAALAQELDLLTLPIPGADLSGCAPLGPIRLEAAARGEDPLPTAAPRRPVRRLRPLRIGAVIPLNPDCADDARQMRRGGQLAVAGLNSAGGVRGRPVEEVTVAADVTSTASMRAAMERLMGEDVDAVSFPYTYRRSPADVAAIFAAAADTGCPVLHHSTSSSAAQVVRDDPSRFGNVFQLSGPQTIYGHGFLRTLDLLADTGRWHPRSRRLLVIDNADTDLQTFPERAAEEALRRGWEVTVVPIDAMRPDWPAVVARIATVDPAAVMLACFSGPETSAFLGLLPQPHDLLVYALYAPSIGGVCESLGPAADGVVWATLTGQYDDHLGRRFAHSFARTFGERAGHSSAGVHFDAVGLLAQAWTQSDSPDRFSEVVGRLRTLTHRGVNGPYHLGSADQTNRVYPDSAVDPSLGAAHLVFQVQHGRHRIIAPSPYATARFRAPASG